MGAFRDFAKELLFGSPSIFGRLVFLAARRDSATMRYRDVTMENAFGEEEVHLGLAALHAETFAAWQVLSQSQQRKDLTRYLAGAGENPRRFVNMWINSGRFETLTPLAFFDKALFARELAVLILLISTDPDTPR